MISKFQNIKKLAVFRDFDWDKFVLDKDGNVLEFKQINILYGRNYSGKTTLSRILKAFENGKISDKFENPEFTVNFKDNTELKQNTLSGHGKKFRVFNDDFIRDNLKFIINPDESIESFAILGDKNNEIEEEIKNIETEIGSNEENNETALYLLLKQQNENYSTANTNYQTIKNQLDSKLNTKATDKQHGIRYKSEKYGDQNYSRPKLDNDIQTVLDASFKPISDLEKEELEKLTTEKTNNPVQPIIAFVSNISNFISETEKLVQQKVGISDKIQELATDAILNKWVKEGKALHKDKRTNCAFCGNDITENRWKELEKHFDEESEKLEKEIDVLISKIESESISFKNAFKPNKNNFYSKYHKSIDRLINIYEAFSNKYDNELVGLKNQLLARKNDIINPKVYKPVTDYRNRLNWIFSIFEKIRLEANNYSNSLSTDQLKAKESLRLREIFDFVNTIKYSDETKIIEGLKQKEVEAKTTRDIVLNSIADKRQLIDTKKRELKDETKGADKVNEYLNNFFGHGFLSLDAIEIIPNGEEQIKKYRFDVIRDGKKAYHLSEGECSLIAFCYFMAKLDDVETKGSKPIIWIDDPISSLDSNHIFFVYSLINTEIVEKAVFEQFFVSTHNLDFLKYLKRLPGANNDIKKNDNKKKYQFFVIQRIDKDAFIKIMPDYLRDYVTEFNFLFHQIYQCSVIDTIDDSNYTLFYNFGNNARKFLEIYLYYKYPDDSSEADKLVKFFGEEQIPAVLTDRINNEYSHLCGVFERGATVVEVPEMNKAAKIIINKIKEDIDQYNALLRSIGESEEIEAKTTELNKEPVIINENLKALLKIMNSNKIGLEIKKSLGVKDHRIFETDFLFPALSNGLIIETFRRKKMRQYCITPSGLELKAKLKL
jgi:wobble nucleotide-excising tRNase